MANYLGDCALIWSYLDRVGGVSAKLQLPFLLALGESSVETSAAETGVLVTRETGCRSSLNYVNRRNKLCGWHLRWPRRLPVPRRSSMLSSSHNALRIEVFVMIFSLRRELDVLVPTLGILEDFAFVIADHDFFVVVIENVAGIDGDFAATTGSVDDELRDAVAGGVAAECFDDFNAFRNG